MNLPRSIPAQRPDGLLGCQQRTRRQWAGQQRVGRLGADRGSTALELVVLMPVLLILIGVLIAGGRTAMAQQAVQSAADQAARTASIARTAGLAGSEARAVAASTLTQQSLTCPPTVTVGTGGFSVPVGAPATVTATVTCVVPLADLGIPGAPGSLTITATADSPLDTYRERT